MSNLMQPRTDQEIKRLGVNNVRQEYSKLSSEYRKIIDGKIYQCHCCGEFHPASYFYPDNRYATGLYPECRKVLLAQATDYDAENDIYIDNREKTIAVFKKLDLPFYDSLYKSSIKSVHDEINIKNVQTAYALMLTMVRSLPQYKNKTFKDSKFDIQTDLAQNEINENSKILKSAKKRFGENYDSNDLVWLEREYQNWCGRTQVDSLSQETYVKQICLQLLDIDKDRFEGKDVTKKLKALDDLMNSANLQPKQNVSNAATDSLTFGQLIEKWENEKPIPEPDEDFKDVNKIGKLIRVFFSGWLCKAFGIKNAYSQECEDYISQYEVSKPAEIEEGGSSEIYDKLFGSDGD